MTVWEYDFFVRDGGEEPHQWEQQLRYRHRPVVYINWQDANKYCQWAKRQGASGCRLPTSEEWYLAAAGSEPEKREFPWGAAEPRDEHANFGMRVGRVTPVGLFPEGATPDQPVGICDLAGNVWEWTASKEGSGRVLRGGSFGDGDGALRAACRDGDVPDGRSVDIGLRCLRE